MDSAFKAPQVLERQPSKTKQNLRPSIVALTNSQLSLTRDASAASIMEEEIASDLPVVPSASPKFSEIPTESSAPPQEEENT